MADECSDIPSIHIRPHQEAMITGTATSKSQPNLLGSSNHVLTRTHAEMERDGHRHRHRHKHTEHACTQTCMYTHARSHNESTFHRTRQLSSSHPLCESLNANPPTQKIPEEVASSSHHTRHHKLFHTPITHSSHTHHHTRIITQGDITAYLCSEDVFHDRQNLALDRIPVAEGAQLL